ncbi:Zonadhesin [Manis pentadactyla]|nr:Zonadhesin [Manis pentadactyla]
MWGILGSVISGQGPFSALPFLAESEQCSIYGDPHYHTFDGLSYCFQGHMTYTLVKAVDMLPDGVEPLVMQGPNKVYFPVKPVFLQEIIVKVYGYTVQLQIDLDLVVNHQKVTIPCKPSKQLTVIMHSHCLYLITDFELVVSFNGRDNAVIRMPSTYGRLVCRLCGNYDGNQSNEYVLPDSTLTKNINEFGNSWEAKKITTGLAGISRAIEEEEGEKEEEPGFRVWECSPEQLELMNSTQPCRVLVDPQGPFAACHLTVDPEPFQDHCVSDQCAAWRPQEWEQLRCQVLSGYVIICQEAGATLAGCGTTPTVGVPAPPPSDYDFVPSALAFPANTIYQSCMMPSPASCASLAAPRDCEGPCVEGCASLPGYMYSGAQSLPVAHCGCTYNGIYYQGDSFVTESCSQCCTCASLGILLCELLSCGAGKVCALGNLTCDCFWESPCLWNPCQNDGWCLEQGAHFTYECELGYGGDVCTEPWDVPPCRKPETSSSVAILLGMLVPMVITVLAVAR